MTQSRNKFGATDKIPTQYIEEVPGQALLELLSQRRGCCLSDPRDMIYAHLGLASAITRLKIPIDYDKSVSEVYQYTTRLFVEWYGLKNILHHVESISLGGLQRGYPSWVPDWTISEQSGNRGHRSHIPSSSLSNPEYYKASWAAPNVLAFAGVCYGSVQTVLPCSAWPVHVDGMVSWDPAVSQTRWDHSYFTSALQWMSRSDDKFLRARDFVFDLIEQRGTDGIYEPFFPMDRFEPSLWAEVSSILCKWASRRSFYLGWTDDDIIHHHLVGRFIFILMRIAYISWSNKLKQPAILGGSAPVMLPVLAQPGDILVNCLTGTYESGHDAILLRPSKFELSRNEQHLVRKDLSLINKDSSGYDWNTFQLQDCHFIAMVDATTIWMKTWFHSVQELENTCAVRKIFALH
ncbi:uncharacterized protein LY89DRAFT_731721 [Mollisia scopiformis]|uniref:Uncharacterized protein n=1 Tax=Mollisia scopiformis TaxID=149040 RepID=A0A194XHR9_MOLSC|nr:uncharacterized protein LY89DRAFT_731721 [Mollisia scopiformis]KUJ19317.1 hypothetical protein LY89DRAFT_731721 [Mollisia scopiformis]